MFRNDWTPDPCPMCGIVPKGIKGEETFVEILDEWAPTPSLGHKLCHVVTFLPCGCSTDNPVRDMVSWGLNTPEGRYEMGTSQ